MYEDFIVGQLRISAGMWGLILVKDIDGRNFCAGLNFWNIFMENRGNLFVCR